MDAFSPVPALIGGCLIGLASAVLWLGNGRVAGISGIFGQALPVHQSTLWRGIFLLALIVASWAAAQLLPGLGFGGPGARPAELVSAPAWTAIPTPVWLGIAGLLTGFGTRIGNGCTSGHGVCGLARLSPRSLVAVATFFGVSIVTVAVTGVV